MPGLTQQRQALETVLLEELRSEFRSLPGWREENIPNWLDVCLPLIQDTEESISFVTEADIDLLISQILDGDYVPDAVQVSNVTGPSIRNGTPPSEVYARPIKQVWSSLGQGKDLSRAIEDGITRLERTVNIDMQLTHDWTAREKYSSQTRLAGYRRVINSSRPCALCIVASTQRYHSKQLKGLHPGCQCTTRPVTGESPGRILNERLLDAVHSEIASKLGISDRAAREIDYRKILMVREHGEYGPTLTYRYDSFLGPTKLRPSTP